MKIFVHIMLCLFCCLAASNAAKILLTTMPQGRSHAGTFMPLMHRLVEDGHEVTVFFEIFRPEIPLGGGVKENMIMLKGNDMSVDNDPIFNDIVWSGSMRAITIGIPFYKSSIACSYLLEHQPEDFYRLSNQSFDIVLTDSLFTTCGYALALLSKKPYILMHSSDLESIYSYIKGYARNYGTVAPMFLEYNYPQFDVNVFLDRVGAISDFLEICFAALVPSNYFMKKAMNHIVDYSLQSFISQSSFSFYDMPDNLAWAMPGANDLVSFGAHCKTAKPLTDEFERFVADPKSKGTIIVAFGTVCKWEFAPKRIVDAFVDALNRLSEYRIIWGYKGPKMDRLKDHVMVDPWIPQEAILQDKRTKLFISHGGLKSLKEAICSETPVVFMPVFAEQVHNALICNQLGFAEYVSKHTVTGDQLLRQARKVLENDSYLIKVKKVNAMNNDRIMHPLEEGAFWVEKTIRYGTKPIAFHRFGMNLYWIQYCFVEHVTLSLLAMFFIAT